MFSFLNCVVIHMLIVQSLYMMLDIFNTLNAVTSIQIQSIWFWCPEVINFSGLELRKITKDSIGLQCFCYSCFKFYFIFNWKIMPELKCFWCLRSCYLGEVLFYLLIEYEGQSNKVVFSTSPRYLLRFWYIWK